MILAGAVLLVGVLDISNVVPKPQLSPIPFANGVTALIFCVGMPVALIARRYIPQRFP
jgi:hypothetical protein